MKQKNIPNWLKVFIAAIFSLAFLICILSLVILLDNLVPIWYEKLSNITGIALDSNNVIIKAEALIEANGFWTLLTLLVSSPVAFIIWHFRDRNVTQQIENARKDTNLKEFQKLAEWVSGIHLIEDKVVEKTSFEEQPENNETNSHKKEITREYTEPAKNLAISTYSKKEGAVGLQISAVYNLLPFYRGDHGESFKKPALNLLTSAWLAMQQKALLRYDENRTSQEKEQAIQKIQENGNSPLGIAITRVLLALNALGKPCLSEHPEILADLCLAGMNFTINGIDKSFSDIFKQEMDFKGNLVGTDFRKADLSESNLNKADLRQANLSEAKLRRADLSEADLRQADLRQANLSEAKLKRADLSEADLRQADLRQANLSEAKLRRADLSEADLSRADLSNADLSRADLSSAKLIEADLDETNLSFAKLIRAELNFAKLIRAGLSRADLSFAKLIRADLSRANLSFAKLIGADLSEADLIKKANLSEADLSFAKLIGADLSEANLSFAKLDKTILIGVDLTEFSHDNVDLSTAILEEATENSA